MDSRLKNCVSVIIYAHVFLNLQNTNGEILTSVHDTLFHIIKVVTSSQKDTKHHKKIAPYDLHTTKSFFLRNYLEIKSHDQLEHSKIATTFLQWHTSFLMVNKEWKDANITYTEGIAHF